MVKVELKHPDLWLILLNVVAQFDADIQSDELMVTVKPYAGAEVHEQANLLSEFRDEICPEIIQEASEIARYLEGQTKEQGNIDPRLKVKLMWNSIAKTEVSIDELVKSYEDIAIAVDNFWHSIGEAMGPVCYEGFRLKEVLKKYNKSSDWVDRCIKYYEDHVEKIV